MKWPVVACSKQFYFMIEFPVTHDLENGLNRWHNEHDHIGFVIYLYLGGISGDDKCRSNLMIIFSSLRLYYIWLVADDI